MSVNIVWLLLPQALDCFPVLDTKPWWTVFLKAQVLTGWLAYLMHSKISHLGLSATQMSFWPLSATCSSLRVHLPLVSQLDQQMASHSIWQQQTCQPSLVWLTIVVQLAGVFFLFPLYGAALLWIVGGLICVCCAWSCTCWGLLYLPLILVISSHNSFGLWLSQALFVPRLQKQDSSLCLCFPETTDTIWW